MRLFLYLCALLTGLSLAEVSQSARPVHISVDAAAAAEQAAVPTPGAQATGFLPLARNAWPTLSLPDFVRADPPVRPAPVQRWDRRRE